MTRLMPKATKKKTDPHSITIIGPAGGESRGRSSRDLIEKSVDPDTVRLGYERFLVALQAIVNVPPPAANFVLEEVEFSAEVSADGEFKLLGTGIGVEAKGGVKFTLRRQGAK
jgi:hypothetical protein